MMTLNHGLSGYVCGRVAMPLLRRRAPVSERAMGWAFFIGAMLPDLDALGTLFGGWIYFSDAWYGHRQASHSILGTLLLALAAALLLRPWLTRDRAVSAARALPWLVGCFWAGGLLHLVGDVVTPRRPLPVFWPLDVRFGAWSHIGWFSPYLLWLFVATLFIDALLRSGARRLSALRPWQGPVAWGVYALAVWRWGHYLVTSRYESGWQWADYQLSLLPAAMVHPLADTVQAAWHWMTR